jgi:iron complex outermembrane receptor protein
MTEASSRRTDPATVEQSARRANRRRLAGVTSHRVLACLSLLGVFAARPALAQSTVPANQSGSAPANQSVSEPAAQSASTADPTTIVITATRRSEGLMNVPIAVTAFTGNTLNNLGVSGLQGLQIATPALVIPNTGAFVQAYIRGVGSRLLQNGFDPSVAVYADGRYISRQSAINLDFADIERVEVLKGPQGVLFGRNSSAGAIRVISHDVTKDFEGYVRAGYGNYNLWTVQGMVNVPLSSTLGVRISGDTVNHDGYATNIFPTGRRDWDDRQLTSVRARLRWQPNSWFDARLIGSYWRSNDNSGNDDNQIGRLDLSTGIRLGGITGVGRSQVASAQTNPIIKRESATELDLNFHLGIADLSSISTYADYNGSLGFDGDGTSSRVVDAVVYDLARTFTQEVRLTSTRHGPLEWLVGAYYYHDNTNYDTVIDRTTAAPASPLASQGLQTVLTKSWAVFGQLKWHIGDNFTLTAGGRFTHDEKSAQVLASSRAPVTLAFQPYSTGANFSKFTPAVTAEYQFGSMLAYATFARGYKSGGVNYPASRIPPSTVVPPIVRPEVLDMYEGGLKNYFFGRSLRTTLSAYYYNYSDLQVSRAAAAGLNPLVTTENAANARLYGVDFDVNWNAGGGLTFTGAVSWQHSEYLGYTANAKVYRGLLPATLNQAGMVDVGFDASGQRLLRAPAFSAFAAVNYEIPVAGGHVPVNVSYAYKGSFLFDFIYDPPGITATGTTSVLRQRAYSLVNGRIGYHPISDRWSVSAWVNNLFSVRYFDDVVAAGTGLRASYAAPRTFGVEVQFKF